MSTRLELVWPNKDKFLLMPRDEEGKPVWVESTHPAASEVRLSTFTDAVGTVNDADPHSDNLLFTGDSLDALRILNDVPEFRRHYRGKVKLVYIDPPFNTGQTFTHYDDWMEHSTWLSFMRDRLLLIKDLLAPDGSVWVHLDDAEVHRMRCLMDEVFGAGNFVKSVIWEKVHNRKNDDKYLSSAHDQLLVYARDKKRLVFANLPATPEIRAMYKNPDSDPRGDWSSVPFSAQNERPNLTYAIVGPDGTAHMPPAGNCWRMTEDRYNALRADGRIYFGQNGKGRPRMKQFWSESADRGVIPRTIWDHEEVGHTQGAKAEMKGLFPGARSLFDTPKPEALLQRIIHVATDEGDIVLDCFGGSGTTAAVAHKMGRRWVTCEVLPATVEAFTRPRLEKVVNGEDPGGITKAAEWSGGGGFRVVEIGPTMYETLDGGLVLLSDWATNGKFSRAVAGQLGFEFEADAAPFCGRRGRMRLAVLDGAVGPEEVRDLVSRLEDKERLTIVAKVVLPETEDTLAKLSPGSRVRKAPRDLLTPPRRRRTANTDGSTT